MSGPQDNHGHDGPRQPWLTWWKLAIIAAASGLVSVILGKLMGAGPVLIWINMMVCLVFTLGFLVVELLFNAPRPKLAIRGENPPPSRWPTNVAVFAIALAPFTPLIQAGVKTFLPDPSSSGSNASATCRSEKAAPPPCEAGRCQKS